MTMPGRVAGGGRPCPRPKTGERRDVQQRWFKGAERRGSGDADRGERPRGREPAGSGQRPGGRAGDVEVTGRLHILSTGSIVGDVRTRVLVVEEGGTLDGRCLMAKEGGSARQEKEKNAAPKDAAASQPA